MPVLLVHGFPETSKVWKPLLDVLDRDVVTTEIPGLGTPRPDGFTASKDAYAEWLAEELRRLDGPVDVVGHDIGALLTMRVASAFDVALHSWTVDAPNIFHPSFVWPERMQQLQTPGVGEKMLETERTVPPEDPRSTASGLVGAGVPPELAMEIASAHDEAMSRSILDFYRSAQPNVSVGWWEQITGPARSPGLVLLLPDPPEEEAMSLQVADYLGAETAPLDGLDHCWMAQAPDVVAEVLERFWSSLE
jgi:pimeloyl-ACP methyl ester carboxylesterase